MLTNDTGVPSCRGPLYIYYSAYYTVIDYSEAPTTPRPPGMVVWGSIATDSAYGSY